MKNFFNISVLLLIIAITVLGIGIKLNAFHEVAVDQMEMLKDDLVTYDQAVKDYIMELPIKHETKPFMVVSTKSTFKSYMDGSKVTDPTSAQYKLLQTAVIENGHYMVDNRMVVAVAEVFGNVGDWLNIKLSSGEVLRVIVGDIKSSAHVDSSGTHLLDKSQIEFVVDVATMNPEVKTSGNFNDVYEGYIEEIAWIK